MRLLTSAVLIAVFAGLMAVCAQINIPMVPVPMTMQTFAVLLAGAVLGPWKGAAAVLTYLALAALGLPILSDGASGLAPFSGPTAGYLFAFPIAAALVGQALKRNSDPIWAGRMIVMIIVHQLILTIGVLWLSTRIGMSAAFDAGYTPFLTGMVVKSALVVAAAAGIDRLKRADLISPSPKRDE